MDTDLDKKCTERVWGRLCLDCLEHKELQQSPFTNTVVYYVERACLWLPEENTGLTPAQILSCTIEWKSEESWLSRVKEKVCWATEPNSVRIPRFGDPFSFIVSPAKSA